MAHNGTVCSLATIVGTVAQLCFHFACHCPKGVAIPRVEMTTSGGSLCAPTMRPALGKFLNKVHQVLRSTKPEQNELQDIEVQGPISRSVKLAVFNFHVRW